ncbi:MAG: hypothetical protein ACD_20C00429G0008 [uncultured bacterium]|nr:MAG: hypothetical protein ACD_20C00429G0008 [uncultured bacterium]
MTSSFDSQQLTPEEISKIPFFADFDEQDLQEVSKLLLVCKFKEGDYVIKEGEKAKNLYFILQGYAKVLKQNYQGNDELISSLKPKHYFGEMALVSNRIRFASVLAETELIVAKMAWDDFIHTFSNNPEVMTGALRHIAKTISSRLAKTDALYANILPGCKTKK